MGLTINFTLLKRRKRDDGTIPIYLRFTEDRKSRYRSTGYFVKEDEWNKKDQEVKSSNRRYKHINIKLRRLYREVEEVRDQLEIKNKLSMERLLREIDEEEDVRSIIAQCKMYRKHLQDEDRYWEQRHFKVIIGNIEEFIVDRNSSDQLGGLNSQWIEDFQDYLLKEIGNSNNTVRKKLQRLKGMTDWLFDNNELDQDPFSRVNRVESKKNHNKVKLSLEQISSIENLSLKRESKLWHVRNYFMYSFYNAGIRFGDLCCLIWGNLVDGRLKYSMNKTDKPKNIKQLPPMYSILLQYVLDMGRFVSFSEVDDKRSTFLLNPSNYTNCLNSIIEYIVEQYAFSHQTKLIFPILEKLYEDPQELRKKISSKNVLANRHLKTIASKANIQSNISFHVSRHSFAHYALKKGLDLYQISKALGHSDLKVTEEYLKTFDEELLDEGMSNLFN